MFSGTCCRDSCGDGGSRRCHLVNLPRNRPRNLPRFQRILEESVRIYRDVYNKCLYINIKIIHGRNCTSINVLDKFVSLYIYKDPGFLRIEWSDGEVSFQTSRTVSCGSSAFATASFVASMWRCLSPTSMEKTIGDLVGGWWEIPGWIVDQPYFWSVKSILDPWDYMIM